MQLINPSVEIIEELDPLKKIELAARTCYKSETSITDESSVSMYNRLVTSNHTAMLEHAIITFKLHTLHMPSSPKINKDLNSLYSNKFLNVTHCGTRTIVSGNIRAINESNIELLLSALYTYNPSLVYVSNDVIIPTKYCEVINFDKLEYPSPEEISAHRYTTMKFVTDRGVTHELVRHRLFSFAQESTRYVNYSKEKFGGGNLKFIKPAEFDSWDEIKQKEFCSAFNNAEQSYLNLIDLGCTAQEARAVLPNSIKTEIIVTGNDKEWQHFFNLRTKGTTGAPHPDMKIVATMALNLYNERYKD